jgi:hypothetical protein
MIDKELAIYAESESKATYPLNIKGIKEYLPVVRVDPQLLLLNPLNHRVNAQLTDSRKKEAVMANPNGAESQNIIRQMLMKTEQYKALKDQLSVLDQREPGVVTREGLLVDGNTRVAALMDLGKRYVEVAVLPKNVTAADVLDIELTLQMEELVKQEYTFTNSLLFMENFLSKGGSKKELARRKGWTRGGERKVELQLRLLQIIEEVRHLSDPSVPYETFDNKEQHLKDLISDYDNLINVGDVDAAEALKWNRLSAIFMGLNKDQVRIIEPDFYDDFVKPRLADEINDLKGSESLTLLDNYSPKDINSGYVDVFGPAEVDQYTNMKGFLRDYLAQSGSEGVEETYGGLKWASRRVAERLIDEQKLGKEKAQPTELIQDAKDRVGTVRANLHKVLGEPGFKLGDLKFALNKLIKEAEKLANELENK